MENKENKKENKMEELIERLEHDENKWLKVQQQLNRQHAETLNQVADLFQLVRQLQAQVHKLKRGSKK